MALTVTSKPPAHTPAYNKQTFDIISTNNAQPNFTYECSIIISATNTNSASASILSSIAPRPDNGRAYYEPQRTIESYCKNEFYPSLLDFQFSLDGAITQISWSVQEKYGTPPVVVGAPTTGSYMVWNAAYNNQEFAPYFYSTGTKAKDLTLAPSLTDKIIYNQKYLFKTWHIGFSSRILYRMYITATDAFGNATSSVIENGFSTINSYKRNYIILNCSPYGLNNFTGSVISGTPGAIIPVGTVQYTFFFLDNAGPPNISSNTYTVNIDEYCSKFNKYVLHFLNRLGNYDSFTFNMLSRSTSEKQIQDYKKLIFERTANPPGYYNYSKDKLNYTTVITNKISLNTDWITDVQSVWLKELFMSPDVYLEVLDDTAVVGDQSALYSVEVTNKNYETKMKVNDKLIQIPVELEYILEDVRQRG